MLFVAWSLKINHKLKHQRPGLMPGLKQEGKEKMDYLTSDQLILLHKRGHKIKVFPVLLKVRVNGNKIYSTTFGSLERYKYYLNTGFWIKTYSTREEKQEIERSIPMASGTITSLGLGSSLDLQNILDSLRKGDEAVITQKEEKKTSLENTKQEFNSNLVYSYA